MSETHLIKAPSQISDMEMEMDDGMYNKDLMNQRTFDGFTRNQERSKTQLGINEDKNEQNQKEKKKEIPHQIVTYNEQFKINKVVQVILNKILKEKPNEPFNQIAGQLLLSANKSYPIFQRLEASPVILSDSIAVQTLQINVYLHYQGRSMLRHTHVFTYDESQATNFIFDKPEDKQGLYKACKFINHDINKSLKDVVFMSSFTADNILFDFIGQKETEGESRKNIIKACSEALVYAVAKCYAPIHIWKGFKESFLQKSFKNQINTKLLISVFSGGKLLQSSVKFSKFYLIIDSDELTQNNIDPIEIIPYFNKFIQSLRKSISSTKGGEASFKVLQDGSFFNANASIIESYKMIEDAITLSGANDDHKKTFQIGINCDAENVFNKEPKDPNKYEQEGQKAQFDANQMIEYYMKLLLEHPLTTYIEDAHTQFDFLSHRNFKARLQKDLPKVKLGLKQVFSNGGLQRLKQVTEWQSITQIQREGLSSQQKTDGTLSQAGQQSNQGTKTLASKGTPTPIEKDPKKATPTTGKPEENNINEFPAFDPNDPNKNKIIPHFANISVSQVTTMSQLLNSFLYQINMDEENQFQLIIDDCQIDSQKYTEIVDLSIGIGSEYLLLKGCQKQEKLSKILRFCEIKSSIFNQNY